MLITRVVIYVLLGIGIGYDVTCLFTHLPTISSVVRVIDQQSGTLLRWGLIALMCHWFLPAKYGGGYSQAAINAVESK